MNYVIAGYSIVLSILFLYGVQLVWRRRRLTRAAARVADGQRRGRTAGDRPMTTAPPVGAASRPVPSGPDAGADGRTRSHPGVAPPTGARPATGSGIPSSAWSWSAALVFLLAKGLALRSTSICPPTRPWPRGPPSATRPSTSKGWSSPVRSIPPRTAWTSWSPSGATRLQVENTGSPPQLFQTNIPVIAVGHFSGTVFVSDQILVKHSSSYIAAHPGRVTAPNGSKR